jgi:hypothetical protein
MQNKTRRLLSPRAIGGYIILAFVVINQGISLLSNVDFVIVAQGNPRLVAVWNFLASPVGNLLAVFLVAIYLTVLVKLPENSQNLTSKKDSEQPHLPLEASSKQPRISIKTISQQPNTEERMVVSVTPNYLLGFYKSYTAAQADKLLEEYVGKWIKISLKIANVHVHSLVDGHIVGHDANEKSVFISAIFNEQKWIDRIRILQLGEIIVVTGKIEKVSGGTLCLNNCEIVNPS